jgi:predicted RecA/RadA family phage recombinase
MARNEVFRVANRVTLPVPSGSLPGDPVAVGALVGVLETARDAAGNATVSMEGGYSLPTTDAVASVGLALYVTSTRTITTTATANTLFGYSLSTKGAGAGTVVVRIAQV